MDRTDKIARERLAVLQLAERLGNAAEACRRSGVDRTSFYQWKRRFARDGLDGLRNRAPVRTPHPQTTPGDVARRIVASGLAHPSHGCDRIQKDLARQNIAISAVTIQKILHKAGLGTHETRWLMLEAQYADGHKKLSREQIDFIEQMNPCFRDRDVRSARAGEMLWSGSFFLSRLDGPNALYVHALVDGLSSYAFATLSASSAIDVAFATLLKKALRFFAARGTPVTTILSRTSSERAKPLRDLLDREGLVHAVRDGEGNAGFIEYFRRAAVAEFPRQTALRRFRGRDLEPLRSEFDRWLFAYNHTRQHLGYGNYGKTPIELL